MTLGARAKVVRLRRLVSRSAPIAGVVLAVIAAHGFIPGEPADATMAQHPSQAERLELERFYHLYRGDEAEGGMRDYLTRSLAERSKDHFVTAMTASGYRCSPDADPRVRQSHVVCSFRTRGRLPWRWPEHWRVKALFDEGDGFEAAHPSRAVLMGEF